MAPVKLPTYSLIKMQPCRIRRGERNPPTFDRIEVHCILVSIGDATASWQSGNVNGLGKSATKHQLAQFPGRWHLELPSQSRFLFPLRFHVACGSRCILATFPVAPLSFPPQLPLSVASFCCSCSCPSTADSLIRAARLHTRVKFIAIFILFICLCCCLSSSSCCCLSFTCCCFLYRPPLIRPAVPGLSHIISLLGNNMFHLGFSHVTPSDHLVSNCSSVHFSSFSESRTVSHVPSRVRRAAFSLRSELESDSNHTSLMK